MSLEKCCLDSYSLELLYECQNMSVLDKEDTYYAYLQVGLPRLISGWLWATALQTASVHGSLTFLVQA